MRTKKNSYKVIASLMALIAKLFVTLAQVDPEVSSKERNRTNRQKDGGTDEEVIEAFDSSGFTLNLIDFRMTNMDYGFIHISGHRHFVTQSVSSSGGIGIAIPYP